MASVRDNYLSTDALTATPQKLQLMLIEGALRCTERALAEHRAGRHDWALGAIVKAQTIVGHILGAVDREIDAGLADKVNSIYEFVFRKLVEAGNGYDEASLSDAIRILEIERETWRQLCEKLTRETSFRVDGPRQSLMPSKSLFEATESLSSGGFSVEA